MEIKQERRKKRKKEKKKQRQILRQCCLSKEKKPIEQLIRFVLSPDDVIMPDIDAKAEGRGVWLSLSQASVKKATQKNIFAASLRRKVNLPKDLAQLTRLRLEQRLLGSLGLARKAGQLVIGNAKVRSAIKKGTIIALITASDGAKEEKDKILKLANSRLQQQSYLHIDILSAQKLSLALGQENVIYGALFDGAAGKNAINRAKRLIEYLDN